MARQPPRVLPGGRRVRVAALDLLEHRRHLLAEPVTELGDGRVVPGVVGRGGWRVEGVADQDRHRDAAAPEVASSPHGDETVCAPGDHGDDRHLLADREAGRAQLERSQGPRAADGGLGEHADQLAVLQRALGVAVGELAVAAVHRHVVHRAHERPRHGVVEAGLLRHEADEPTSFVRRQPDDGEVEVADVVYRHDRGVPLGQVLRAADVDLQAEEDEQPAEPGHHHPVHQVAHSPPPSRSSVLPASSPGDG
ncbi:hypothetical protein GCM10027047_08720 [Rhodococcus aerolatus]